MVWKCMLDPFMEKVSLTRSESKHFENVANVLISSSDSEE